MILMCTYSPYSGAGEPGGSGGVGPPLELEIYLVKFLKIHKKKIFFSIGPPLGKNRSSAPEYRLVSKRNIIYMAPKKSCDSD